MRKPSSGQSGQGLTLTGQGSWSGQKPYICREVRVVRVKPENFSYTGALTGQRSWSGTTGAQRMRGAADDAATTGNKYHPDHSDHPDHACKSAHSYPDRNPDRTLTDASDEQLRWRARVSGKRLPTLYLERDLGLKRHTRRVPSPLSLGESLDIVVPHTQLLTRLARSARRHSLLDDLPMLDAGCIPQIRSVPEAHDASGQSDELLFDRRQSRDGSRHLARSSATSE